jgi:hypothetical protein
MAGKIEENRRLIAVGAFALLLAVAGCGGDSTGESVVAPSVTATSATPDTTTSETPDTTATSTTTPTTTSTTTTTTTTIPPTPDELRADYLDSLEARGWTTYNHVHGWSIMHPSDWQVLDEDGEFLLVTPSEVLGALTVAAVLDAADTDLGSEDYLLGGAQVSAEEG